MHGNEILFLLSLCQTAPLSLHPPTHPPTSNPLLAPTHEYAGQGQGSIFKGDSMRQRDSSRMEAKEEEYAGESD